MKYYQNIEGNTATGGGSYIEDNLAHERFNFKKQDDVFYGFAQSSKTDGGMNLARIDNNIQEDAQSVNGVLVIFVADGHIVGYYKNARVYGEIQNADNYDKLIVKLLFWLKKYKKQNYCKTMVLKKRLITWVLDLK